MNSKPSKNLKDIAAKSNDVIKNDDCAKIKGGGYYFCCTRNKWIEY